MIRCKLFLILLACNYCTASSMVKRVQDEYLDKTIIAYLGKPEEQCNNIHSYVCDNNNVNRTNEHVAIEYWKTMKRVENILSSTDTHEYSPIAIEQDLYQDCLTYGNEDEKALKEIQEKMKIFEELLIDMTIKSFKWQKVDHKLAKLGLGNAFFNIKVIEDPSNYRKRIIMIEPPTLLSLNNLLVTLDTISEVDLDKSLSTNKAGIVSFYNTIKHNGIDLIKQLVTTLIQNIEITTSVDRTKIQSEKMTIAEWSKKYNRRSTSVKPANEINWPEVIFHEFYKVNINLYDTEPVIVKNVPYFSLLFSTLFGFPNDIIGLTVIAKAATEHLRYIDFEFAQDLHKRDRASFCITETKLYGVSQKILFDLCKEAINKQQTRKIQEIIYNILADVKNAIYNARFSFGKESYLVRELENMITHVGFLSQLQNVATNEGFVRWTPSSLPQYYDTYKKSSHSYLNNIINYRQMLKLQELRSLKAPSHALVHEPFSLVDIHVPANRFILNVFFNLEFFKYNYYKEQVFGTYGAKLATLIYGLLNENKAADTSYYDYTLRAHPDFALDETNCVDSDTQTPYSATITNRVIASSVGLDIAFDALHKPISNRVDMPAIINPLNFKNVGKADQIFFLSYGLFHCDLNNTILNDIIFHSTKFTDNFPCQSWCKYEPFKNVDENIFLIKL